jgi:hypothetical protein
MTDAVPQHESATSDGNRVKKQTTARKTRTGRNYPEGKKRLRTEFFNTNAIYQQSTVALQPEHNVPNVL